MSDCACATLDMTDVKARGWSIKDTCTALKYDFCTGLLSVFLLQMLEQITQL